MEKRSCADVVLEVFFLGFFSPAFFYKKGKATHEKQPK
jgi:hypothetical protein